MRTVCLFVLLCVSALSYGAKKYKLVDKHEFRKYQNQVVRKYTPA